MTIDREQWAEFMSVMTDIASSLKRLERPLKPRIRVVVYGSDDPKVIEDAVHEAIRKMKNQVASTLTGQVVVYANRKGKR